MSRALCLVLSRQRASDKTQRFCFLPGTTLWAIRSARRDRSIKCNASLYFPPATNRDRTRSAIASRCSRREVSSALTLRVTGISFPFDSTVFGLMDLDEFMLAAVPLGAELFAEGDGSV
jgi:hypothetical protein